MIEYYTILLLRSAKCLLHQPVYLVMVAIWLGAVHKCQRFHKCTNHTLSGEGGCENQLFSVHF